MDVHVLDWTQSGGDEIGDLNIKKKDIEEIKDNVVEFKPKEPWSVGYNKWKEQNND